MDRSERERKRAGGRWARERGRRERTTRPPTPRPSRARSRKRPHAHTSRPVWCLFSEGETSPQHLAPPHKRAQPRCREPCRCLAHHALPPLAGSLSGRRASLHACQARAVAAGVPVAQRAAASGPRSASRAISRQGLRTRRALGRATQRRARRLRDIFSLALARCLAQTKPYQTRPKRAPDPSPRPPASDRRHPTTLPPSLTHALTRCLPRSVSAFAPSPSATTARLSLWRSRHVCCPSIYAALSLLLSAHLS